MLDNLVQGTDLLVLVLGESGSGKTTLLHRYLFTSEESWKAAVIKTDPAGHSDSASNGDHQAGYPVFIQQEAADPIVIVDDAHRLPESDLRFLLLEALVPESAHKIKRLVLFGEPSLSHSITALSESTGGDTAINKITMPVLTREESASYLQYRPALAGYTGESLFTPSVVKMIHKKSEGLPGRMNELADQWLKKKYAPTSQKEGIFTLLKNLPLKALGWGAVAVIVVVLGLFAVNLMVSTPRIPSKKKTTSQRVFRAKIPAVKDSETPKFTKRMAPTVEETTTPAVPEKMEPSPAAEQPTVQAKVTPQPVKQPQVKPPSPKPEMPPKAAAKNTIFRESWLLDQESSFYTLQVLGVRNEESLLNFIKVHKLLQNQNVAYYKTVYKGKRWYPLLYGIYPTKSEAKSAVKELPDKVQKSIPWIRKMSAIQKEVLREAER